MNFPAKKFHGRPEASRVSRIDVACGHSFFPHLLRQSSVVVDLGGNRGEFSRQIRTRFGCDCILVEPNPALFEGVATDGVRKFQYAITSSDGAVALHLSHNPEASSIRMVPERESGGTVEVPGIRLSKLLDDLNVLCVDLLKVDIEGAEIAMFDSLEDARLRQFVQISVEFHDFNGMAPRLEVERVRERMRALGFVELQMSRQSLIDVLYVNNEVAGISRSELLYTSLIVPKLASLLRATQRLASKVERDQP